MFNNNKFCCFTWCVDYSLLLITTTFGMDPSSSKDEKLTETQQELQNFFPKVIEDIKQIKVIEPGKLGDGTERVRFSSIPLFQVTNCCRWPASRRS